MTQSVEILACLATEMTKIMKDLHSHLHVAELCLHANRPVTSLSVLSHQTQRQSQHMLQWLNHCATPVCLPTVLYHFVSQGAT